MKLQTPAWSEMMPDDLLRRLRDECKRGEVKHGKLQSAHEVYAEFLIEVFRIYPRRQGMESFDSAHLVCDSEPFCLCVGEINEWDECDCTGIELKPSYYRQAVKNVTQAAIDKESNTEQPNLFAGVTA